MTSNVAGFYKQCCQVVKEKPTGWVSKAYEYDKQSPWVSLARLASRAYNTREPCKWYETLFVWCSVGQALFLFFPLARACVWGGCKFCKFASFAPISSLPIECLLEQKYHWCGHHRLALFAWESWVDIIKSCQKYDMIVLLIDSDIKSSAII